MRDRCQSRRTVGACTLAIRIGNNVDGAVIRQRRAKTLVTGGSLVESIRIIASQLVEEGEEPVGWPVAPRLRVRRRGASECALLESEVGVQVDQARSRILVTEP